MIKAVVIKKLVDENNEYTIRDRVRIKMKPPEGCGSELASEYIGNITDIRPDFVIISNSIYNESALHIDKIDMIRFAEPNETFENKWDF